MATLNITDGTVVREQLQAVRELGLQGEEIRELLKAGDAGLAALWELKLEKRYDFSMIPTPVLSWLFPQLQSLGIKSLRSNLLKGGMATIDLSLYRKLWGYEHPTTQHTALLAFSESQPVNDPEEWQEVRSAIESQWGEHVDLLGTRHITIPTFLWKGATFDERFALARFIVRTAIQYPQFTPDDHVDSYGMILTAKPRFTRELLREMVTAPAMKANASGEWRSLPGGFAPDFQVRVELQEEGFTVAFRPMI